MGEMLLSVAVKTNHGNWNAETIIARWTFVEALRAGANWANFRITGDDIVKVPTKNLDTVLLWAPAKDNASASVYLPPEIRPM